MPDDRVDELDVDWRNLKKKKKKQLITFVQNQGKLLYFLYKINN